MACEIVVNKGAPRACRLMLIASLPRRWVSDGDSYDLRAAGADAPQPYEVDGNPTDITASLASGKGKVGYSRRYARNWDSIFGKQAPDKADDVGDTEQPRRD